MHNTYLKTLDLSIGASKTEIKAAYRRLSKKYHPDVNKSEDAQERFIAIHEAYKFLMDVGPKPNNETITYNYDPYDAAYATWREKAKAYARQKAREAQRQQKLQLLRLLHYFDFLAVGVLVFNLLLVVDYVLPKKVFEENVVAVHKVYENPGNRYGGGSRTYRYDDVYLENFYMRVDGGSALVLGGETKVTVVATSLFESPLYILVSRKQGSVRLEQSYGLYQVFGYIIPVIFLAWLFYRLVIKNPEQQLTLSILIVMLFMVQLFLFFRF